MKLPRTIFFQLAVDGPAGCGKSTCTALVAKELKFRYVDTGALYRCVTLKALRQGIPKDWSSFIASTRINLCSHVQPSTLTSLSDSLTPPSSPLLKIPSMSTTSPKSVEILTQVYLDDNDVSEAIREPKVTEAASKFSRIPELRAALLQLQRDWARLHPGFLGVAMEGRDIGTNVLPQAHLKIFLTADLEIRAKRRWAQHSDGSNLSNSLNSIQSSIASRDQSDQTREVGKLALANDAIVLDTSLLNIEETVKTMTQLVQDRMKMLTSNDVSN